MPSAPVPELTEARIESAELTQVVPTEYRADLVVLLLAGRPVLGFVVEAQLTLDADKRWSWPVYLPALRARLRCPCALLVVTPDESVARWAAEPIALGQPGFVLTPLVVGPAGVPVVSEVPEVVRAPELGVLSAMAHGFDDVDVAVRVATTVLAALDGLDEERARLYADLVLSRLSAGERNLELALRQDGDRAQGLVAELRLVEVVVRAEP